MARVTVEDCLKHCKNRFDLVLKASKRARNLDMGSEALIDAGKDKSTVIALREVANGYVHAEQLSQEMYPEHDE